MTLGIPIKSPWERGSFLPWSGRMGLICSHTGETRDWRFNKHFLPLLPYNVPVGSNILDLRVSQLTLMLL